MSSAGGGACVFVVEIAQPILFRVALNSKKNFRLRVADVLQTQSSPLSIIFLVLFFYRGYPQCGHRCPTRCGAFLVEKFPDPPLVHQETQ